MDLNLIIKTCWTIIVVILTLIFIGAFVETIIKKIQEPKRKKEALKVIDKATEDFIKYLQEELDDKKPAKKTAKTSKKPAKKKEDK